MTDLIGKIFDRKYRLTRLIGEGGMGAVYEAEHTRIERRVAVKVMHSEFSSSTEVADRFFREAQASSAIGHPNIIEIFDVGRTDDNMAFIVMELLDGESLSDRLTRQGRLPVGTAVAVILQVLSALAMAHKKGIIHRDLKPDNVFLAIDNRGRHEVKLLDFGIAKIQGALEGDQGLTKTGTVLGTPNYMSPEQARGKDIDHRIDIWSAGVMLYEMLSGQLPYQGTSYNAVLSDILLEMPRPLRDLALGIPEELLQVVEKAMAKDRDRRYANVQAMIGDLLPLHENAGELTDSAQNALKNSISPPPTDNWRRENPMLMDTAALTPDPAVMNAMAGKTGSAGVGTATLRELELGSGLDHRRPRRRVVPWFLSFLVGAVVAAFAVQTLMVRKENQSLSEAGLTVLSGLQSLLEESPLSPFRRPPAEPPSLSASLPAAMPSPPDMSGPIAGAWDAPEGDSQISVRIVGASPRAKITLNGKPVLSRVSLVRSDKTATLRIEAPGSRPFQKKLPLSSSQVVDLTDDAANSLEADGAQKKKGRKNRKRANKQR